MTTFPSTRMFARNRQSRHENAFVQNSISRDQTDTVTYHCYVCDDEHTSVLSTVQALNDF